jgi:hypothetical protein
MVPVFSSAENVSFVDLIAKGGDGLGRLLSIGIGHRTIFSESYIGGAYFFIDNNKLTEGVSASSLHPGAEIITNNWDFHLNAYIPLNNNKLTHSDENITIFSNHQEYLGTFNQYNQFAKGLDAIVGRRIPAFRNSRVYGAGYYYDYKSASHINGVEVGLQTPITDYVSILARDSYDNFNKNQFSIGISITFGGVPEKNKTRVEDHLLDPVQHYSGTLNTGTGTPVQTYNELLKKTLVRDNIWFFDPASQNTFNPVNGINNCTFEHPCSGTSFTQVNINSIDVLTPNPNLYVNTGIIDFTGTLLELPNGVNLFGRQNNFHTAGSGNNRPLFNGTFRLDGNNNLNDLRINGSEISIVGFTNVSRSLVSTSSATGKINIDNVAATASSSTEGATSAEFHGGDILIKNSTLTSNVTGGTDHFAIGLRNGSSTGTITIYNSTINALNTSTNGGFSQGASFSGSSIVNISGSIINATNINGTSTPTVLSTSGIRTSDTVNLIINNSTINTDQRGGIRNSAGIQSLSSSVTTINNSTFNVFATQPANNAYATYVANASSVTFNNSTLIINNPVGTAARDGNNASTLNNTTAICNGVAC